MEDVFGVSCVCVPVVLDGVEFVLIERDCTEVCICNYVVLTCTRIC